MGKLYLALEFSLLFLGVPLLLRYNPRKIPPLPVLWLVFGVCFFLLLRDPSFDRVRLWNPGPLGANLSGILVLFAIGAAVLGLSTWYFAPQLLFSFVRANPAFWALVMLLYPVLSVYPQGLIYRAFLMHRYEALFSPPWALVLASAVAFSLMHIVFRNPLAMALTFAGGILFAWRYEKTGSLFVSSFEHALYGCFLFTIGLGRYFYARAI
jgi:membrane protease YdiL (CAAX protease family)